MAERRGWRTVCGAGFDHAFTATLYASANEKVVGLFDSNAGCCNGNGLLEPLIAPTKHPQESRVSASSLISLAEPALVHVPAVDCFVTTRNSCLWRCAHEQRASDHRDASNALSHAENGRVEHAWKHNPFPSHRASEGNSGARESWRNSLQETYVARRMVHTDRVGKFEGVRL